MRQLLQIVLDTTGVVVYSLSMKATKVIVKFANEADGIEAVVAEISQGFSVTLRDTDADEYVGIALIYKNLDLAIAKAKEVVA
jgi:hypothetical protein